MIKETLDISKMVKKNVIKNTKIVNIKLKIKLVQCKISVQCQMHHSILPKNDIPQRHGELNDKTHFANKKR
jgi:hypothetical protein